MYLFELLSFCLLERAVALPQQFLPPVVVISNTATLTTLFAISPIPSATTTTTEIIPSQVTAVSCATNTPNPLRENVCLDFPGNVEASICCPAGTACEAVIGPALVFLCN